MVRSLPFHLTVLPDTKLEPVIVRVNAAPPVVPVSGEIVLKVGAGLLMVKVEVFDEPPPGVGLETTIEAVPAVARSPTVIVALTCVELMKAVVRSEPFHLTTHPLTKLVPVTVKVRVPDPAFAETGFIAVRVGVGLLMEKVEFADVPPPGAGFETEIDAVPAVAMSLADIEAVSWLALIKVVVRVLPFHRTVLPLTKFDPLTVKVNVLLPACVELGLSVVIDGEGFVIEKDPCPEVPPPGVGLNTVTAAVPDEAISEALIVAVSCPLLMNCVTRSLPFHLTTLPETKLEPLTVSVN